MKLNNTTIEFNKSWLSGVEIKHIQSALSESIEQHDFASKSLRFLEEKYSIKNAFLTKSCTDALEMAAILVDIKPGDEIIIPSFTFVSTANAFRLRGAKIVFADSESNSPNIDASKIEELITSRTRAIIPVHYGGISCDMGKIMELAKKYDLFVIEDAAHSIDGFYNERPLGTLGNIGTFSFHGTKNITCGEGGLLIISDEKLLKRAAVLYEKGTNRIDFEKGNVEKYEWMDIGSSYRLSEVLSAYLYAQFECLEYIQNSRKKIWDQYFHGLHSLQEKKSIRLPFVPSFARHNAHIFYLICNDAEERLALIKFLKQNCIHASFHYQSLHTSPYFQKFHDGRILAFSDKYSDCLLRLPIYPGLNAEKVDYIIQSIHSFYVSNEK